MNISYEDVCLYFKEFECELITKESVLQNRMVYEICIFNNKKEFKRIN